MIHVKGTWFPNMQQVHANFQQMNTQQQAMVGANALGMFMGGVQQPGMQAMGYAMANP